MLIFKNPCGGPQENYFREKYVFHRIENENSELWLKFYADSNHIMLFSKLTRNRKLSQYYTRFSFSIKTDRKYITVTSLLIGSC